MPLVYLGFLSVALVWLFFAMVWALALLFWPVTLAVVAWMLWRGRWRRAPIAKAAASAPRRDGANDNSAFAAYRQETLHRLDEEQGRFQEFLARLRRSRDKQEFEAYMAARRGRPAVEGPRSDAFPA